MLYSNCVGAVRSACCVVICVFAQTSNAFAHTPRLSQSVEEQRSEAEERVRSLEREVARLSQELQEEQQRQDCLEQTQEKTREEYARYAQTTPSLTHLVQIKLN